MPIEVGRLGGCVSEVGVVLVLTREPYGGAQANASAAAFQNAPVRRGWADRWGLKVLLDGERLRDPAAGRNLRPLPRPGYQRIFANVLTLAARCIRQELCISQKGTKLRNFLDGWCH